DGRLPPTSYPDALETPPLLREIRRSGTTLTYPGGDAYSFAYSGPMITQVTHLSTGATAYIGWDSFRNPTSFRTNLETTSLISLAYTYTDPDGRHVASVTATDILGNRASATFNAWNLPTEIRALALIGSGHADQVTRFTYDGGGPLTQGNLTRLVEAFGTASEDGADFLY